MSMWRSLVRRLLFCLPPEQAHYFSMGAISALARLPVTPWLVRPYQHPSLHVQLFGLSFDNPVGLAAGFDKDARWLNALSKMGFGFIEAGTLTRHAQPGNPRPRLFRLPSDQALVNRMGFNNHGADEAAVRLQRQAFGGVIGINIGKSKVTPLERAIEDYLYSFNVLASYASYVTINVSSPNTPGLRKLQERQPLDDLLAALQEANRTRSQTEGTRRLPILLKIAPDLDDATLDDIIEVVQQNQLDGIIATNTTVERGGLRTPAKQLEKIGTGGLSGGPLTSVSRAWVRKLYRKTGGQLPIIGVGGIMNGEDAWRMLEAGASLVQVYTGFIYGGPRFVTDMNRFLAARLQAEGLTHIRQVVGSGE